MTFDLEKQAASSKYTKKAIEWFLRFETDLVILDVLMPRLNKSKVSLIPERGD